MLTTNTTPRNHTTELIERLQNLDAVVLSGLFYCVPLMLEAATQLESLQTALDRVARVDDSLAKQLSQSIATNATLQERVKELEAERLQVREILAGSDYSSLPDDWTLARIADARMNDIHDLNIRKE